MIKQSVALFDASDETVDMVQRMLGASGFNCLIGCPFPDLRKGHIDFARFVDEHDPEVIIFDISPPYAENWAFFKTLCHSKAMEGRGLVVTTGNRPWLDAAAGTEALALEIVGKPYNLDQINGAIQAAVQRVRAERLRTDHSTYAGS